MPCPVGKEKRFLSKSRPLGGFGQVRESQQETLAVDAKFSAGRGHSLAKACRRAARDALLACVGLQNRFGLRLLPLPLPIISQVALSEAGSVERGVGAIRRSPRKPLPSPPMRGSTISVPQVSGAPGRRLSAYGGTVSHDPRPRPNPPRGRDLDTKAVSLWTVNGPFLFFAKKRNGGFIPAPQSGALPRSPEEYFPLFHCTFPPGMLY